jgi:hypothetical protein
MKLTLKVERLLFCYWRGVCVITTNLTGSCVAGLKRENDLISKTAGSPEKYCNWRRGFHGRNHFRQLAFARTSDYC